MLKPIGPGVKSLSESLRRVEMPSGIVMAVGKSRTGKPTVTIDNQIYSASKVDLSGLGIGDKIEFDSASSVYNGATVWFLNGYKTLVKAPGPGPAVTPSSAAIAVRAPSKAPLAAPIEGLTEAERITISNWVAHAIQAGLVKDRADLGAWAIACKEALRLAAKPTFEEDIP
jgi:hypothetical protein